MTSISGALVVDEGSQPDPSSPVLERGMMPLRPFGALDHVDGVLVLTFAEAVRGAMREVKLGDDLAVAVTIPPGVWDGQVLRVPGGGVVGMPGLPDPADRYLLLHVEPDPRYRRDGRDLHLQLPVSIREAAFGAVVELEAIDGPVKARVPPGTESGHSLRFRGKGVSGADGVPSGHLYVTLQVVLPEVAPDDDEAREAILLLESRYAGPVR